MQSLACETNLSESATGLVVLDPPRSGAINMAIDESLLANAQPNWPVILRIYQWEEPTLSLGHFQKIEDRDNLESLRTLPWVRRKTGGGAIVHDHELTYSILFPNRTGISNAGRSEPTKGHSEALYRAIHLQFAAALKSLGWDAKLSESCTCKVGPNADKEPFLCFSRRSPVDLVVGDAKILGSAQRRSATGLLQHGSFMLRRSAAATHLAGLLDVPADPELGDHGFDGNFDWQTFFIATLKDGVDKLLQVQWRDGKLCELPGALDEKAVVPRA